MSLFNMMFPATGGPQGLPVSVCGGQLPKILGNAFKVPKGSGAMHGRMARPGEEPGLWGV